MIRNSVVGWTACVFLCWAAAITFAEQPTAAELYSRGVSAYFSGDTEQAIDLLSRVIERKPRDPRPRYFRGLAMAAQFGLEAAQDELAEAARIEASTVMPVHDVDDALERIQGALRLEIEQQRKAARQAAAERRKRRAQARYERLQRREKEVLFDPDRPVPEVNFPLPEPKVELDPFASEMALSGGKQVQAQPAAVESPDEQPDTSGVRDPFSKPKTAPPPAQPAPKKPPVANPFGDMEVTPEKPPADEAADPFGEAAQAAPQEDGGAASGLFGTVVDLMGKTLSGQGASRDPFAEPGQPAAKKPAAPPAEKPAAPAAPAKKPATPAEKKPAPADDPFK